MEGLFQDLPQALAGHAPLTVKLTLEQYSAFVFIILDKVVVRMNLSYFLSISRLTSFTSSLTDSMNVHVMEILDSRSFENRYGQRLPHTISYRRLRV